MGQYHSSPSVNGTSEMRATKRKRLSDPGVVRVSKRQTHSIATRSSDSNSLADVLGEYELLKRVVSNLCAGDLLALALTSKALHNAIIPRPVSLENILGRVNCSGEGIRIRNQSHQKSTFFYSFNCTEHAICGTNVSGHEVETKPCITCKVATCDECRIHCVYQSIFEASSDPTELPNFSGFVLLQPQEHTILSPHHLASNHASTFPHWQDPSTGGGGPYHDQGYLDAPLESAATASPVCIEDILDLDLGQHSLLSLPGDSRGLIPSPVLQSLCEVVEARKIYLCDSCFENHASSGPAALLSSDQSTTLPWLLTMTPGMPLKQCVCTLRSRILDRWLCLRCYAAEEDAIESFRYALPTEPMGYCCCARNVRRSICLWCWGEVKAEAEYLDHEFDVTHGDSLD
jgi:hypothetical protein